MLAVSGPDSIMVQLFDWLSMFTGYSVGRVGTRQYRGTAV